MSMEGGCFCGAVRYRQEGEPLRVTHCHCLHCRRTTGAPMVTWVEVRADGFRLTRGTPGRLEARAGVVRTFCTRCGTQLTYRREDAAETLDLTAGSLDEPEGLEPQDHLWCDRMVPWLRLEDGLARYPRGRD